MKNIYLDVFGCDTPEKLIVGAAKASTELEDGYMLIMPGNSGILKSGLEENGADMSKVTVVDTPEVITNEEDPVSAVMKKRDSSLVRAMELLRSDECGVGLVSAGNTGAVLCSATAFLGRLPGVSFPALATYLPCENGRFSVLLDCGANVDVDAHRLCTFALLGTALARSFLKIGQPNVALVSLGVEDKKGNALTKEAFGLMRQMPELTFMGNMEARDVLSGRYDVMVCDGFAGNMILKSIEGSALFVLRRTAEVMKKLFADSGDMSLVKKTVGCVMEEIDFTSIGGAMLLGVEKPVVKAHGNANEKTVGACINQLIKIERGGLTAETRRIMENSMQKQK